MGNLGETLTSYFSPDQLKTFFYVSQVLIAVGFFTFGTYFRREKRQAMESTYALRTSGQLNNVVRLRFDPPREEPAPNQAERPKPLLLTGINIHGEPHEVLGVSPRADLPQIQKAYREMMKRYHPDLVGRPGSREWQDAQKIAEAINRAKELMVQGHRYSQRPRRSGR